MYTGLDGLGPFDGNKATIYVWRCGCFEAQGGSPVAERPRGDWAATKKLFSSPMRLLKRLFGKKEGG